MDVERSASSVTVKWLLEEPIVYGARLDITTAATPGLSDTLKAANLVTFGQLVNLAGSNLAEAGKLAERLGTRSTRVAGQMLERYKSALTTEDWRALQQGDRGDTDTGGQFPRLLLGPPTVEGSALDSIGGKGLYRLSVEVLNKVRLGNMGDTPWRANLGMGAETQPAGRDLYRLPLPKYAGDLQWRILHGVVPCSLAGLIRKLLQSHVSQALLITTVVQSVFGKGYFSDSIVSSPLQRAIGA
ncbi:hypothetical protein SKAU_G00113080 [Synaphobranchus kaupii]|uniref:Uncharacterized protein n=1 Tax=Synaphobranchus kaupii TaxID=118154 RepID=A0A9Q1J6F1_SYNKA|nr:hypothetical protein SKAU_G00113080 [Synaphobranchus kaupii]